MGFLKTVFRKRPRFSVFQFFYLIFGYKNGFLKTKSVFPFSKNGFFRKRNWSVFRKRKTRNGSHFLLFAGKRKTATPIKNHFFELTIQKSSFCIEVPVFIFR